MCIRDSTHTHHTHTHHTHHTHTPHTHTPHTPHIHTTHTHTHTTHTHHTYTPHTHTIVLPFISLPLSLSPSLFLDGCGCDVITKDCLILHFCTVRLNLTACTVWSLCAFIHSGSVPGGSLHDADRTMRPSHFHPDQTGRLPTERHCGDLLHVLPNLEG